MLASSCSRRSTALRLSNLAYRVINNNPNANGACARVRLISIKRGEIPTHHDPAKDLNKQDKLLFTPGPLTTSYSIKKAMMMDLGSRDKAFIQVINEVRDGLLRVANVNKNEYTAIPMQGSGTFGVEAVISSVVPRGNKDNKDNKNGGLLVISNGAYGLRIRDICLAHKIPHLLIESREDTIPELNKIEEALKSSSFLTHVAVIHSETTSGIINDIESIGQLVAKYNKSYIVDAMSSFGAVPIDFSRCNIDYLISSSNKCIEGVPGFSFVIARKSSLMSSKGNADTVSLDIHKQEIGFESNSQFRFTPPTHSLIGFAQALAELHMEGDVAGRALRYQSNQKILQKTMDELGFVRYLKFNQGYIISSYRYPTDSNWNFHTFYTKLNDRGFVIYPGKVSNADCFRIGHIGRIFPDDTQNLCRAIIDICKEMKTAKYAPSVPSEKKQQKQKKETKTKTNE